MPLLEFDQKVARTQSSNQLLQPLDGLMIVNACRTGCGTEDRSNVTVVTSLLRPKKKHFTLKSRELGKPCTDAILDVRCSKLGMRIGGCLEIAVFKRDQLFFSLSNLVL